MIGVSSAKIISRAGGIFLGCTVTFMASILHTPVHAQSSYPIRISSNSRYFLDTAGQPCLMLGDTEWELFMRFSLQDATTLCEDRRVKGFNTLLIMLLGVGGGTNANINGDRPFVNNDPSTPNTAFFDHVEAVIDMAAQKNLVCAIGIYHKSADYSTLITTSNARAWGRWVGTRFADKPNVIWSMYPSANSSYVAIVRELAAGLDEGDGGTHLITMHPDPSPASSSWIHEEAWLDFNTLQTFGSSYINHEMVADDYARTPVKPAVNGEARYEEEGGTTPLDVRRGAYWSVLAGGYYCYGHGGNWISPESWASWIDAPGGRHMKVLGDFFRSLEWWKLVPDNSIITNGPNEKAAARSSDGDWMLVYFHTASEITVDMSKITAAETVDASWIDPTSGTRTPIGSFPSSGTQSFTPSGAWDSDALLFIESADVDPNTVGRPRLSPPGGTFVGSADVTITSQTADARIYYTTDGGDPHESSTPYSGSLGLSTSCTVRARAYKDGLNPSSPASAAFTFIAGRYPDNPGTVEPGLEYEYYTGTGDQMPDFSSLTPAQTGIVPAFNLSPAVAADDFAMRYTGYVEVTQGALYTFFTRSDDGSILRIGDTEVVNNDGAHAAQERSGTIALKPGLHAIEVAFFEAGGGQELTVSWSGGDVAAKEEIPAGRLYHAAESTFAGTRRSLTAQAPAVRSIQGGFEVRGEATVGVTDPGGRDVSARVRQSRGYTVVGGLTPGVYMIGLRHSGNRTIRRAVVVAR